jgi:hypothetical protein
LLWNTGRAGEFLGNRWKKFRRWASGGGGSGRFVVAVQVGQGLLVNLGKGGGKGKRELGDEVWRDIGVGEAWSGGSGAANL